MIRQQNLLFGKQAEELWQSGPFGSEIPWGQSVFDEIENTEDDVSDETDDTSTSEQIKTTSSESSESSESSDFK